MDSETLLQERNKGSCLKVKCSFCGEKSHNERTRNEKFAEEYLVDEELYVEPGKISPVIQESQTGEEMTQADDIPPFTQESQADEEENRAMGSHYFIAINPFKPPTPVGQTQSSSFPPRNGPNIRVPAPMSFRHSENMYPDRGSGPVAPVPVVKIEGKRYVTLSNLEVSMAQGSKNKNKKKYGKKKG
ncbi:hypothetical protein OROMI_026106 [Orobanche minor]